MMMTKLRQSWLLCLLLRITALPNVAVRASSPDDFGPDAEDEWEEFLESLESAVEAENLAQEQWTKVQSTRHIPQLLQEYQSTQNNNQHVNNLLVDAHVATETLQHEVDMRIRRYNRDVIQQHLEILQRDAEMLPDRLHAYRQVHLQALEAAADLYTLNETYASDLEGLVRREQLLSSTNGMLNIQYIWSETDTRIQANIRGVVADSLNSIAPELPPIMDVTYLEEFDAKQAVLDAIVDTNNNTDTSAVDTVAALDDESSQEKISNVSTSCPTLEQVVKTIQQSLLDHQAREKTTPRQQPQQNHHSFRIVHEMTSPTYQRPSRESDLVRHAWWRNYIPGDWATLLPSSSYYGSWEDYDARTINSMLPTSKSEVLPPSAILYPQATPGACWPMDGSSGKVTMMVLNDNDDDTSANHNTASVTSVTIHHVSPLLLRQPDGDHNDHDRTSAPRYFRLVGYPPCRSNSDDDTCHYGRFDSSRPIPLISSSSDSMYDIHGPPSQTFAVKQQEPKQEGDASDEGSCSATAATCGTEPPSSFSGNNNEVAAVALVIEDNWGNEDYTCLYRVQMHTTSSTT